jgi:hypothetical protein
MSSSQCLRRVAIKSASRPAVSSLRPATCSRLQPSAHAVRSLFTATPATSSLSQSLQPLYVEDGARLSGPQTLTRFQKTVCTSPISPVQSVEPTMGYATHPRLTRELR